METIEQLREENNRLKAENEAYKNDVETTVNHISRLLMDLGVLTPDNRFEFNMKHLTRSLLPIITNPGKVQDKFSYLANLRVIIEKYSNKKNHETISAMVAGKQTAN